MNQKDEGNSNLKSFFHSIPNEILVKILQQLTTFDLLQFCTTYPEFKYFLEEKKVIRTVNLSRKTGFRNKFYPFLSTIKQIKTELITIFNITNVYWVPAEDIRKCLKSLDNVEEMHLLGTKVGLTPPDYKSFRIAKLRKLGVTIQSDHLKSFSYLHFPVLKSLCLQIVSKEDNTLQIKLERLISNLAMLEELWIYDVSDSVPLDYDQIALTCKNLEIFVFKALCSIFTFLSLKMKLSRIFSNDRTVGREVYCERTRLTDIDPRLRTKSQAWKVLNDLHVNAPYGLYDAEKLHKGNIDINEIFFEELSFIHTSNTCCPRYRTAIKDILGSKNVRHQKKLALTNCLFEREVKGSEENSKRLKMENLNYLSEEHMSIVKNLKTLKELEIWICSRHDNFGIYHSIQHLRYLTKLTLEVPALINGEFLKNVMQNCDMLESLKINVTASNELFNRDFSRYISLAKNLKELRYEHYRISLENLFMGLAQMKGSKMEKLYIKSKSVDNYGMIYLKKFFEHNPNMEFALIIINTATNNMLKKLSEQMKIYKNSPEKNFLARKNELILGNSFPIPDCFKFELTSSQSHVATLNIYEDFYFS